VELISISKKDFANIVADGLRIKWDTNAMAIRNSPYFRHLTDIELHKCSAVSFIKTYTENDHVLGKYLTRRDFVSGKTGVFSALVSCARETRYYSIGHFGASNGTAFRIRKTDLNLTVGRRAHDFGEKKKTKTTSSNLSYRTAGTSEVRNVYFIAMFRACKTT